MIFLKLKNDHPFLGVGPPLLAQHPHPPHTHTPYPPLPDTPLALPPPITHSFYPCLSTPYFIFIVFI